MKNSAWYYKLWLKKLSKIPLKEDSGSAWAGMKDMLDAQMPVSSSGGNGSNGGSGGNAGTGTVAGKPFVAKLVSLVGYALPVAAAIGVTTYLVLPVVIKPEHVVVKKKQQSYLPADSLNGKVISVFPDSVQNIDTVNNSISSANDLKEELAINSTAISTVENGVTKMKNSWDTDDVIHAGSGKSQNVLSIDRIPAKENTEVDKVSVELAKAGNKTLITDKTVGIGNIGKASVHDKKSASKVGSSKKIKTDRTSKIKEIITTPSYDFGLESGWNAGKNSSLYLGAFGSYGISTRLLLNVGIRLNTPAALSGSYITKPTKVWYDTLSTYKVADRRKVMVLNVPLTIEYRVSNRISINAGPVISFPLSQSNVQTVAEIFKAQVPTTKYLDSARNRAVDSTLRHTKVNKINLGLTGGISVRFNQFYIEGKYLRSLTPYKVSNALGGYEQYNGSFQLGLRYKFKK